MLRAILLFSAAALVSAGCDNKCSGHGTCGEQGICTCYDNWGLGQSHDSGDCSQRVCPFELAWVDKPTETYGLHHQYAECAARGVCNRDSGECECFPGYEGKGCQRTTCPNSCSGHGTCEFIEDMPYGSTIADFYSGTSYPVDANSIDAGTTTIASYAGPFGVTDPMEMEYIYWDKMKIRGCMCDPAYGDVDCSKRLCPHGTDIMDVRQDLTATAKYHMQHIALVAYGSTKDAINGKTFSLTFKSKLNETFTTTPITVRSTLDGLDSQDYDFKDFMAAIESALESLPNGVIDDVKVAGSFTGLNTINSADNSYDYIFINVSFTGDNVQGRQNFLTVNAIGCDDGCTPKQDGLELDYNSLGVWESQYSDFNSFECGRRGKCDYTTGVCQCFAGYTGIACNTISALV